MSDERDDLVGSAEAAALPRPGDLMAALGTLTVLPLRRPDAGSEAFGRAALFFPLVGLLIGGLLLGVHAALVEPVSPWWAALCVVALWEGLTAPALLRAHQWHGVARLVVIGALVATKTACVAVTRPAALLFAPLLARWSLVVLATGVRDVAAPARKFNPAIAFREFAVASVFTFAVVFTVADALGVLLVVAVAGATLALRLLVHRVAGGVSWAFLLASTEGFEIVVLALCTIL